MEVRPGYKRTGVGVIPEDWNVKRLGELGEALIGLTYKPSDVRKHGILVLRSSNIQNDVLAFDDNVFVDTDIPERIKVRSGDVLVCVRNGSRNLIGKAVLLDERTMGMTFGAFMAVYRSPIGTLTNYLFQSEILKRQINEHLGATINQITNKSLNSFRVPVSPLDDERCAIATALSDVDALLGGLDRLIAKKRDVKQATMQQLLTGQTRLPGFNGGWEVRALKKFVRTFIVPMRDKPKRLTGDIPWCRIEDCDGMYLADSRSGQRVDTATIRSMNLKVYPAGTLLVSCSADLGRCAIVARPLVSNQTFIGLEMDDRAASNVFFYYLMTSKADELNGVSSGTTISYLPRERFEEFAVFAPLDKHEQVAIAAVLSDMDAELSALEVRRDKTRDLKQAMMQELLTGRTRLI